MVDMAESFKAGLQHLNAVPENRLIPFLERITAKAHLKGQSESTFTQLELRKLEKIFNLNSKSVQSLVATCHAVLEHAVEENLSGDALANLLLHEGVSAPRVAAFQEIWEFEGKQLIERLNEQLTAEKEGEVDKRFLLTSADWRLHLQVADSTAGRKLEPSGILQLRLQPASHEDEKSSSASHGSQLVPLEFTYDELAAYLDKLQRIQEQLDASS